MPEAENKELLIAEINKIFHVLGLRVGFGDVVGRTVGEVIFVKVFAVTVVVGCGVVVVVVFLTFFGLLVEPLRSRGKRYCQRSPLQNIEDLPASDEELSILNQVMRMGTGDSSNGNDPSGKMRTGGGSFQSATMFNL